jgi:hypothetical protein
LISKEVATAWGELETACPFLKMTDLRDGRLLNHYVVIQKEQAVLNVAAASSRDS